MKGRRRCWSIDGANNLGRLLCLKHTGKLSDAIGHLTAISLPEKYAEEVTVSFSAADISHTVGKGYDGYRQSLAPPSPDYKWLRDMGSAKLADLL
jgi:hypothetical protein